MSLANKRTISFSVTNADYRRAIRDLRNNTPTTHCPVSQSLRRTFNPTEVRSNKFTVTIDGVFYHSSRSLRHFITSFDNRIEKAFIFKPISFRLKQA